MILSNRKTIAWIRKVTAPTLMGLVRILLNTRAIPQQTRAAIWRLSEKYLSFYGSTRTVRTRTNHLMQVNSSVMVEKQIFFFGEWEPKFSRYLREFSKSNGIFLDVGANIGYFSLLASDIFSEVHAIEASENTYRRLDRNISENNVSNVRRHNIAIGDRKGKAAFYLDPKQSGGSSLVAGDGRVLEGEVDTSPLFDLDFGADISRIEFIKIDVEGFEHIVLRQILSQVDFLGDNLEIMVEFDPKRTGDAWSEIEKLARYGFEVMLLQEAYDLNEYLDKTISTKLEQVSTRPDFFCDLLLRRIPAPQSGVSM